MHDKTHPTSDEYIPPDTVIESVMLGDPGGGGVVGGGRSYEYEYEGEGEVPNPQHMRAAVHKQKEPPQSPPQSQ